MSSQHGHHVIPKKTLYKVFGVLVMLTLVTGLTAEYVELGALNVPLAIAIAASKAVLVATFFMALKYDNKVNTLVVMLGLVFVGVFLIFTLLDTAFRGDLGNVGSERISDVERLESTLREQASDLESRSGAPDPAPDTDASENGTGSEPMEDNDADADTAAPDAPEDGGESVPQ